MMIQRKCIFLLLVLLLAGSWSLKAEDGYRLWLRYDQVQDAGRLKNYRQALQQIIIQGNSPVLQAAGQELGHGLEGLLGTAVPLSDKLSKQAAIVAGTPANSPLIASLKLQDKLAAVGPEGYLSAAVLRGEKHRIERRYLY